MSILIKGMEMPTDGRLFAVVIDSANGTILRPREDGAYVEADGIIAVPVPPHGRLIDADAVEKQIDYVANLDWNKKVGASGGMLAALDIVEDALTIIEEEGEE